AGIDGRGTEPPAADGCRWILERNRTGSGANGNRHGKRRVSAQTRNNVDSRILRQDRVSSAHGSLAVLERIPREADAWLKVHVVGVIGLIRRNQRARGAVEVRK